MAGPIPTIAITPGEPAGIGPGLVVAVAMQEWPARLVLVGDPDMIARRAAQLGAPLALEPFDAAASPAVHQPGQLAVLPVPLAAEEQPGKLNTANSAAVLRTLEQAADGCTQGLFDAICTAPVHKGIINDAGIAFSGHTEFFAERTGTPLPVMLLVAGDLRVALVTTHLALADVPAAITAERIEQVLRVLDAGLRGSFGIAVPRITVLGLNPHAGEGGHLGHEEQTIIEPVLDDLRGEGRQLRGPLPADTAFTPARLAECDAVLAMYHDQGLPVLKNRGFGRAVNVTLGLPVIRTSVDHGTALDLAGSGKAHTGSMQAAVALAIELGNRRQPT